MPPEPRKAAPMPIDKLTDVTSRNAKPGSKPARLPDGAGLYLEVAPTGGKLWRWKYRFGGKEKRLSVGTYPETSLREARTKRDEARKQLAAGIDPSATRKAEKASRPTSSAGSFEAVAREWHAAVHVHKVSEGHAARTLIRLEQDVFPWIGSLPVSDQGCVPTSGVSLVPTAKARRA
ncbi:MAG: Arm DNA-binding domain-containing protein [Burkholderiaceae bacterium]